MDDSILGIGRNGPVRSVPGRCVELRTFTEAQFAINDDLATRINEVKSIWPQNPQVRPQPIDVLPAAIAYQPSGPIAGEEPDWDSTDTSILTIAFAVGDMELAPVGWELNEGEHGVVSGPAGCGKTTTLATIAVSARDRAPDLTLHVLCGRRRRLAELTGATFHQSTADLVATLDESLGADRDSPDTPDSRHLVLIDDAEFIDDAGEHLARLLVERRPGLWIVASGRPEALRSGYGHFTATLRKSRQGYALRPNRDIDGELWMTPLPRRKAHDEPFPAGRGFLIRDGGTELAQVMVTLDQRWLAAPLSTKIGG
jgi:DNA segregation ATPase FtsK/SpoIIIE, S-DNA-T family